MANTVTFMASKIGAFYLFMVNLHLNGETLSADGGDGGNGIYIMNNKIQGEMSAFQSTSTFCCYDNRMQSVLLKGNMTICWGLKQTHYNIFKYNFRFINTKGILKKT